jgi:hypothetical protein
MTELEYRLDSIGIIARPEETLDQYLTRGKKDETFYTKMGKWIGPTVNSVPIPKLGFEKPAMPVIYSPEYILNKKMSHPKGTSVGGICAAMKVRDKQYPYSLVSKKIGKESYLEKQHEELHAIRVLAFGKPAPQKSKFKRFFYDSQKVNSMLPDLYDELLSYHIWNPMVRMVSKDNPELDRIPKNRIMDVKYDRKENPFLENTKEYVKEYYLEPSKNSSVISIGLLLGMLGYTAFSYLTSQPIGAAAIPFDASIAALGSSKAYEYKKLRDVTKNFEKIVNDINHVNSTTDYSVLPMLSRLDYKEVSPVLSEVKKNGIERFLEEKANDPKEGYRWKIIQRRTKETQKPLILTI